MTTISCATKIKKSVVFSEIAFYRLCFSPFVRWNWRAAASPVEGGLILIMRDENIRTDLAVVDGPRILINVVSRWVKQLKRGSRALVESLERLSAEDIALRENFGGGNRREFATLAKIAVSRG